MIPKDELKQITANGYKFAYFDDGVYTFMKGDNRTGFWTIQCGESDIKSGNIIEMLKYEYSLNDFEASAVRLKYKSKLKEGR